MARKERQQHTGGIGKAIGVSLVGNIVPPLAAILTAPVLATSLGVAGRGEVSAATAPMLLAASLVTFGLPEALTYFSARREPDQARRLATVFLSLAGFGAAATVVIWLLAPVLSGGDSSLAQLTGISALVLVPTMLSTAGRGLAAGYQLWTMIAVERCLGSVARMIGIVGLALTGQLTVFSGALTIAITTFLGGLAYLGLPAAIRRISRVDSGLRTEPPKVSVFTYGLRLWLGIASGTLLARLDQSLMVLLSGAYQLGLYSVSVTISELTLIVNTAIRDVLFATESAQNNSARLAAAARISTVVTALGAVAIGVLSIWAIPLFFGAEFSGALLPLWILLLGVVLGNPGSVAGAGLSARGRPGLRSLSMLLAVLFSVAAFVLLAPPLGAVGAAWATVVGNIVAGWLNVYWLHRFFQLPVSDFIGLHRSDLRLLSDQVKRRIGRG